MKDVLHCMEGHETEVVKDDVSQAGGWQESLPPQGSSSKEGRGMGQDAPVGAGMTAQWHYT